MGQTLVNMTQVTDNWGDGIKFYISNLTIHDFQKNFTWERGFCNTPSSGSQVYPVFEHQDIIGPNGENKYNTYCSRVSSLDQNEITLLIIWNFGNNQLSIYKVFIKCIDNSVTKWFIFHFKILFSLKYLFSEFFLIFLKIIINANWCFEEKIHFILFNVIYFYLKKNIPSLC